MKTRSRKYIALFAFCLLLMEVAAVRRLWVRYEQRHHAFALQLQKQAQQRQKARQVQVKQSATPNMIQTFLLVAPDTLQDSITTQNSLHEKEAQAKVKRSQLAVQVPQRNQIPMQEPVATTIDNDTGYTRKQILKMGLNHFTDIFCSQPQHRRHPDESAAGLYSAYKRPDNQRRIAHLSAKSRKQALSLYAALKSWEETAWSLRLAYGGGGTAWISEMIVSAGYCNEFLGRVIGLYEHSNLHGNRSVTASQVISGGTPLLTHCEKLLGSEQVMRPDNFRQELMLLRRQTATLNKALTLQSSTVQRIVNQHLKRFDVGI